MATLAVDGNDLVVRLSALEKIGALRGNIRVPLASVRAVRVSDTPWSELRGIRAPGTGLPRVISLGTRRGPGVHDFAAATGPIRAKPAASGKNRCTRLFRVNWASTSAATG
jgi:hypothetical protein